MTNNLTPPPNSPTWDYTKFKDWLYKLWKWVTVTLPGQITAVVTSVTGLSSPYGPGAPGPVDTGYSNSVAMTTGMIGDGGTVQFQNGIALPAPLDGGYSNTLKAAGMGEGQISLVGTGGDMLNTPGIYFSAQNTSGQAIGTSANVQVTGWTVLTDTANAYNASSSEYIIPAAGLYLVSATLLYSPTNAWVAGAQIYTKIFMSGGSTYANTFYNVEVAGSWAVGAPPCIYMAYLAAGAYITVVTEQTNGNTQDLDSASNFNFWTIVRVV